MKKTGSLTGPDLENESTLSISKVTVSWKGSDGGCGFWKMRQGSISTEVDAGHKGTLGFQSA